MLQSVSVVQARNNFSDLISQAYYGGKKFLIKKMKRPFAVLLGIEEYQRLEKLQNALFDKIRSQREKNKNIPLTKLQKDIQKAITAVRCSK